jgi:Copper binding periplasmic protein CusF
VVASGAKTLAVAALCLSSFSFAQTNSHTSSHHTTDLVEGVVEMVDAALLDKVKAGDKVKFRVETIGGASTVTVIEVAN